MTGHWRCFLIKRTLNLINCITCEQPDVSSTYTLSHSPFMTIKQFVSQFLDTEHRCLQVFFSKYSFQCKSYSVFSFLPVLVPKQLTPTGVPSLWKISLLGAQRWQCHPVPPSGMYLGDAKRLQPALYPRDIAFFPRITKLKTFWV